MIYQHVDGRYMHREAAGGKGGGTTHAFDRVATADEVTEHLEQEKAQREQALAATMHALDVHMEAQHDVVVAGEPEPFVASHEEVVETSVGPVTEMVPDHEMYAEPMAEHSAEPPPPPEPAH